MSSIIFKQSYKARDKPGTAGLNVRHLQYIATRPGAVYNQGCGFGLWGQLPGNDSIRIQNDLTLAKRIVRAASADHTLYRAIVSVGKKDAEVHGLYHRERWEQLVNDHISILAKEMGIKPEHFCWCASMHYTKGHPHVHILYWDNSDQPRPEGIPKHLWPEKAERIRAEFAKDIFREEILDTQKEQRSQLKELRSLLQSMCLEANPEKALDLPRLYTTDWLEGPGQKMAELIQHIPVRGSLRYAYLPPDYKDLVNSFIDSCLEQPELAKELTRYQSMTNNISELYANGEEEKKVNLKNAMKKLYTELGNEVMDAIRETKSQIREDRPTDNLAARSLIYAAVSNIVPSLESYQQLRSLLPGERIPLRQMERQIPGFHDQLNQVIGDVVLDARIRLRLQAYALEQAGIDLAQKPAAPKGHSQNSSTLHVLEGKVLADREWDTYQEIYREAKRELRSAITEKLRQEAGWTDEAIHTGTAHAVCSMMGILSRLASQQQARSYQGKLRRLISRDRSKEAQKDLKASQSFSSEWDANY